MGTTIPVLGCHQEPFRVPPLQGGGYWEYVPGGGGGGGHLNACPGGLESITETCPGRMEQNTSVSWGVEACSGGHL